nr:family 1 glycosylhydrolase [Mycoplasmopsis pullorum]
MTGGYESEPNELGLKFYDQILDKFIKCNIESIVTISHYEIRLNSALKYDGFKDRKVIDFFVRYVKVIFESYKNKVKYWSTFNEMNMLLLHHLGAFLSLGIIEKNSNGTWFNEWKVNLQTKLQAFDHQMLASAHVVKVAH